MYFSKCLYCAEPQEIKKYGNTDTVILTLSEHCGYAPALLLVFQFCDNIAESLAFCVIPEIPLCRHCLRELVIHCKGEEEYVFHSVVSFTYAQ